MQYFQNAFAKVIDLTDLVVNVSGCPQGAFLRVDALEQGMRAVVAGADHHSVAIAENAPEIGRSEAVLDQEACQRESRPLMGLQKPNTGNLRQDGLQSIGQNVMM